MVFQPWQCFSEHRYFEAWPRNALRTGSKTGRSMVFAGVLRPSVSDLFFEKNCHLSSIDSVPCPTMLEQVHVDIVFFLHTILICLAEQLWVWARANDARLHAATNASLCTMSTARQFAGFQQLYSVLASSMLAFCK